MRPSLFLIRPLPYLIVIVTALLPGVIMPAHAGQQTAAQAIRDEYAQFDASFKGLDADATTAIFAPSYQGIDEHGKTATLAQTKTGLATIFHLLSSPRQNVSNTLSVVHTTIQSLQVSGDTATARVTERLGWTERGMLIPTIFEEHALMATDLDTWQRTADGWRVVRSHVLNSRLTHGPVRGQEEAMTAEKMRHSQAQFNQTMDFARQMSQMRNDQFNESMFQSHMSQLNQAIDRAHSPY